MPFFDLGGLELFFVAVVALIVVGPKDLPKLMRQVGRIVAKIRGTARHFKAGMDEMVRQAELDEMREKWDRHNEAIMRQTGSDSSSGPVETTGRPAAEPSSAPAPPAASPSPGSKSE